MQHANLPLQKAARKNVTHAQMYVFIRPFAICMHGSSASVAKGPPVSEGSIQCRVDPWDSIGSDSPGCSR